ncbi:Protein CBG06558 [Caenorhabditis briggsae]|uniref:SCP domain-containing protein n=2 Tax=Caenorhabditis briggsae TaxID=6238 RepID=A0AAE9CZ21_CAEBR|nr:Protein CBG06558 [Caenorhabditis briggsae]ULT88078.1 hypothetical protein L3Y34_007346 [Caenorhabditis briggsae]CAP26848.1 Protein CBG06558 [Caenorhabditis briggsae]
MKTFVLLGFLCIIFIDTHAQLTDAGKTAIVNAHNKLRSTLAQGKYNISGDIRRAATNMKMIGWNDDLARDAYRSIYQCPANIGRPNPAETGANIRVVDAVGTQGPDEYAKEAVAFWEKQFQDKGWPVNNTVANLASQGLAEATQMAFSLTGAMGCGVQKCGSKVATVCYYKFPLKNDYLIYEMGTVCSSCPDFHVCNQPTGLCTYQQVGK